MKQKNTKIELNRWIASTSKYSRRKATELIKNKQVSVNQITIDTPYTKIDPQKDKIKISGKKYIPTPVNLIYYAINKPVGYVSSTKSDSSGSPPITTLIKENVRVYPVGRLDIDSEGLIVLTNDGDLTYKLTHPKSNIEKEYLVTVKGKITSQKINSLEEGIDLREGATKSSKLQIISQSKSKTVISIVITEGKNRQIRRMLASVNLHVERLIRIRIGSLKLGKLQTGKFKKLSKEEVELLKD